MAIGNGGDSDSNTPKNNGVVIGTDYLNSAFPLPNNGLVVEGYIGAGLQNPQFPLDVSGDINFTGHLTRNGQQIYLPDTAGNGGTTLMLLASDNGTPMYLHVTSMGIITVTNSP